MTPLIITLTLIQASSSSSELQWFASLGVGGILAGFMFFVYRQDRKKTEEDDKSKISVLKDIVEGNTAAQAQLAEQLSLLRQAIHLNRCPYIALNDELGADAEARARLASARRT